MTDILVGILVAFVLLLRFWIADRILTGWKR
jgi:hypothetical protein